MSDYFVTARNSKQLGTAIQRFRKTQKLSQQQLAALANIKQPTVSVAESGNGATLLSTMFKILAALDLEIIVKAR